MSFEINKLSLNYWNGRGLMEVPRMMLAYSGHFPDNKVFRDFTKNIKIIVIQLIRKCFRKLL